jgi:hypothetical protein
MHPFWKKYIGLVSLFCYSHFCPFLSSDSLASSRLERYVVKVNNNVTYIT